MKIVTHTVVSLAFTLLIAIVTLPLSPTHVSAAVPAALTPSPQPPTNTPRPAPTNTPRPAPTGTPRPAPTDTPRPAPTDTPPPAATDMPVPHVTHTPLPHATSEPTDTPRPTRRPHSDHQDETPTPTEAATFVPTEVTTQIPTPEGVPTIVNTPELMQTAASVPTVANVPTRVPRSVPAKLPVTSNAKNSTNLSSLTLLGLAFGALVSGFALRRWRTR